jgi:hypothetical protein
MVSPVNRPNFLRSKTGEAVLGSLLTVLLLFFGFRFFWDNGLWGLLQLFVVSLVTGVALKLPFLNKDPRQSSNLVSPTGFKLKTCPAMHRTKTFAL